jgi:hypothetical protein
MKTLDEALADLRGWPSQDKAVTNQLYYLSPQGRKRKPEDGYVMSDLPTQRMRFSSPIEGESRGT